MKDVVGLRCLIQKEFDSEASAARALGWTRQKLNGLTTGRRQPSIQDVRDLANLFGMEWGKMAEIFFGLIVTKRKLSRGRRRRHDP